jgi:hypothetical protein
MSENNIFPGALVLVAILPSPEDLQVARMLGWYRIPIRTAPRILNVDYLAFYQPASFLDRKWRVEYYAPVLGHELTTRLDLLRVERDHPRADEEYFKVQLGPVRPLRRPISAGDWKRFTFLYTTGEYLQRARILTDLSVPPGERRRLWKALRERGREENAYQTGDLDSRELSLELLSSLLGIDGYLD